MDFVEFVENELKRREWSRSDLARKSGLTPTQVTRVLSRKQNPGNAFIEGIARAFDVTIETVMRRANILPSIAEPDAKKQELDYLLSRVPETVLDDVLEFTRFIVRKRRTNNEQKGKG